ncbi:MAG: hypothetical protein ACRC6U_09610 [Fusobacteriaceae bacterium]
MKNLIEEAIRERIPEVYNFNIHYMISKEEYLKDLYMTILTSVCYGNEISPGKILYLKSLCKSLKLDFEKILMVSRKIKKEDFIEFSRKFSKNDMGEHFFIDLLIAMGLNGAISTEDGSIITKLSELVFLEKKQVFELVEIAKGILEKNFEYITSKKFNFINYFFPKDSDLIIVNKKITIDSKTNKKQIFTDCEIKFNEIEFENFDFKFINCKITTPIHQIVFKKTNLEIVGCKLNIGKSLYEYFSALKIEHSNLQLINNEILTEYNIDRSTGSLFEINNSNNVSMIKNKINYGRVILAKNINKFIFIKNEIDIVIYEYENFSFEDIKELKFEENRIFSKKLRELKTITFEKIKNLEIIRNNFEINLANSYDNATLEIKNCSYKCKENIYPKNSRWNMYADDDSVEMK